MGKANSLRDRVRSYFSLPAGRLLPKTAQLVSEIAAIDYLLTESEIDALILEANLIRKLSPHYNVNWKDGKSYPLIEITIKDPVPLVRAVHQETNPQALYFGPYPTGSDLTSLLRYLRRLFPFVSQKHHPGQRCLRSHLGLCPCPNFVNYHKTLRQLIHFLSGERKNVQKELQTAMNAAAKKQEFETASEMKRQLAQMEYVTAARTKPWEYEANPNLVADRRAAELSSLQRLLGLPKLRRIECYDISSLAGKQATGAQVTFIDAVPEKKLYRHYKIKRDADDVTMIKEVINRRLKSTIPLPDLIVIDGGKEHKVTVPVPTIYLAKRLETIYFQNKTIQLPASSPALQLIQRLRDEAHRFSRRYHFWLRAKNMVA